ncbi:Hypothetical predicted protein [Pelobates cultripes]|uniref:Uncharacterized protein n=1 Tax=Pelobates cultripes TaxID=61616 RepID=A0AAD1TDN1_PELCU|nr:Hypothetical predicted protein [Pelobates cultripes]
MTRKHVKWRETIRARIKWREIIRERIEWRTLDFREGSGTCSAASGHRTSQGPRSALQLPETGALRGHVSRSSQSVRLYQSRTPWRFLNREVADFVMEETQQRP